MGSAEGSEEIKIGGGRQSTAFILLKVGLDDRVNLAVGSPVHNDQTSRSPCEIMEILDDRIKVGFQSQGRGVSIISTVTIRPYAWKQPDDCRQR